MQRLLERYSPLNYQQERPATKDHLIYVDDIVRAIGNNGLYMSAEILMLQYIVNLVSPGHPVLHLYTGDDTIDEDTTTSNMTEATEAGYAPITLVGTGWTTTSSGGVTTAVYSEQTFTFTTGSSVYGYYVTDTSDAMLWVERFAGAPFTLPDGGGTIAITPKITLE